MYQIIFLAFVLFFSGSNQIKKPMKEKTNYPEFQVIVEIGGQMAVGWGYYIHCKVLEVKSGDMPKLKAFKDDTNAFIMGWTAGFKGRTVSKDGVTFQKTPPMPKEKYLLTFYDNETYNEKEYTAPVTGFTDATGRIWFLKELQKL